MIDYEEKKDATEGLNQSYPCSFGFRYGNLMPGLLIA